MNNGAILNFKGASAVYIAGNGAYISTNGGIINPSSSGILLLEGNWLNNSNNTGFLSDSGLVILNGANQTIGGSNATTFYNLSLAGTGVKTQNINTSVGGTSLSNGIFSLNNSIYNLNGFTLSVNNSSPSAINYSNGYIESEINSAINTSVLRWNLSISPNIYIYPFGVSGAQIPLTLNKTSTGASVVDISTRSTLGSDNLPWAGNSNVSGVTFFYCPNNALIGNPCASNSVIDRWWDITPSNTITADVTFSYRAIENTLNAPYNVGLIGAQWWDGTTWNQNNATVGNALASTSGIGSVTANNLSQFCPFILSSVSVPLPIELTHFSATCEQNLITLIWKTASETNSKYFLIERSQNAIDFELITQVEAAGNSYTEKFYQYIDRSANLNTNYYYRLKEVDINNNIKKHPIINVKGCLSKQTNILINNTTDGKVIIDFHSENSSVYTIQLYDMIGKCVFKENIQTQKGNHRFILNNLPIDPSIYLLTIFGNTEQKQQKVKIN